MSRSRSLSLTCDNCGAKIAPAGADNIARCEFCGHQVEVHRSPPPQDPPRAGATWPAQGEAAGARPGGPSLVVPIVFGIALAIGAATLVLLAISRSNSTVGSAISQVVGEKLIWDTSWKAPLIVEMDGKEHLIGRIRRIPGDDQLMVAVIESASVKQRWRTPPLGTYLQAYQASPFAAAAGKLIVADYKNMLRIYELASGQELKAHPVTDRVKQICPLPDSAQVWIQLADEHHLLYDLEQLKGEPGQRPAQCPKDAWMASHTRAESTAPVPVIEGFKRSRRFEEGDLAVVTGVKHPGTAVPMAAGFEPATRQVRWKRVVPTADPTTVRDWHGNTEHDALAAGRFVATYGVGADRWRVVGIDARSGDTLWDVELRDIFAVDQVNSLSLSPQFVYVVRTSSLEVLKAATGELVGTVGRETYE